MIIDNSYKKDREIKIFAQCYKQGNNKLQKIYYKL